MKISIGIVGGGAAGMTAAIAAAKQGAAVTLIEGNDRLGKKILSTGNGKCNLGNENLDREAYYTGNYSLLEKYLRRFGTEETVAFFQGLGLMIKSRNGYLYPLCGQAAVVLDVLRYAVREAGVEVVPDCRAEQVGRARESGRFWVQGGGRRFSFDRLILACGGRAAPKTGSDGSGYRLAGQLGHSLIPVVPALVQLKCREDYFKAVAGVRTDAELSIVHNGKYVARERGELQLTDSGISGIPVFGLSRTANYLLMEKERFGKNSRGRENGPGLEILINLLPDYSQDAFEALYAGRRIAGNRTVEEFFTGMLHKKLMLLFIRLAGLKPSENIAGADAAGIRRVFEYCRKWRVHVIGSNGFDAAQVCAGGVPLDEVTDELESKKAPGLYFAGELLDVDGKCGGYNLQWAWCSGHIAGSAAARESRKPGTDPGHGGSEKQNKKR